jgi:hypothetical protein
VGFQTKFRSIDQKRFWRSIVARLVVQVDRDKLDLAAISRLQNAGQRLPHAMRAFIDWLRPRIDGLRTSLPVELAALMAREFSAALLGSHLRAPGGWATLYLGLTLFLSFARELGVVTADEVASHLEAARAALLSIGRQQAEGLAESAPSHRLLEILRTLFAQGRVRVHERDCPFSAQAQPMSEFIGWQDDGHFYLLPEAVVHAVAEFLRQLGETGEISRQRLLDEMTREKMVVPGSNGKPLTQLRFDGHRHRVLVVPRQILNDDSAALQAEGV